MMGLLQLCQTAGPAHVMDLLDWLVPPAALDDARLRTRHRGIAKALLTISLVVSIMLLAVAFVRGGMGVAFILFFLACIVTPKNKGLPPSRTEIHQRQSAYPVTAAKRSHSSGYP